MIGGSDELLLINALKQGDRKAMRAAYELHAGYLTAVCSRYLANAEDVKDALQEAFIRIFSSIVTFQPRSDASLRSWMTRIVVHEAIRILQRSQRLSFIETMDQVPDTSDEAEIDCELIPFSAIQEMIQQLPDTYRTVLNLYVFEQRSHKEIASLLGIKENTSACQFHRAKNCLAKMVEQYKLTHYGR